MALLVALAWLREAGHSKSLSLSLNDALVALESDPHWQELYRLDEDGAAARVAIFAHPRSRLRWPLDLRRGRSRVSVAAALLPEATGQEGSDGVLFRVSVVVPGSLGGALLPEAGTGAGDTVLASREVFLSPEEARSGWRKIDLSFASPGSGVALVLDTESGATRAYDWALWSQPLIREETSIRGLGLALSLLLAGLFCAVTNRETGRFAPTPLPAVRRLVRGVTLAGFSSVLVLLVVEMFFRQFPLTFPAQAAGHLQDEGLFRYYQGGTASTRFDQKLGFLHRPHQTATYVPEHRFDLLAADWLQEQGQHPRSLLSRRPKVRFETDGDGFRNPPGAQAPAVIAIGDSFTEGDQSPRESTWPSILERALAETRLRGGAVRNLGVGGYGPQQYAEVLARFAAAEDDSQHPAVAVVLLYLGNDLMDAEQYVRYRHSGMSWMQFLYAQQWARRGNRIARARDHWFVVAAGRALLGGGRRQSFESFARSGGFGPVEGRLGGREVAVAFHDRELFAGTLALSQWRDRQGLQETTRVLERLKVTADRSGMQLMVALAPSKASLYLPRLSGSIDTAALDRFLAVSAETPRPPDRTRLELFLDHHRDVEEAVLEACRAAGVACNSLFEPLSRALEEGEEPYFRWDPHWNEVGHRVVGEALAAAIEQETRSP